jgi:hypothetical protein
MIASLFKIENLVEQIANESGVQKYSLAFLFDT